MILWSCDAAIYRLFNRFEIIAAFSMVAHGGMSISAARFALKPEWQTAIEFLTLFWRSTVKIIRLFITVQKLFGSVDSAGFSQKLKILFFF